MAETAADWKAKGNAALGAGNPAEAIEHYTKAIELDSSGHVFFSNRSAAYVSNGQPEEGLADAEECIRLKPEWVKGYGRKGAALHAKHKYDDAIAAYNEGLAKDPENAALKSGLEEVTKARDAPPPSGGPFSGMANPFGEDMWGKLASNPKFAPYLQDPTFVEKLKALQRNPNDLNTAMHDPRMIEVFGFLLGIPLSTQQEPFAPSPSDTASAPKPTPAAEPAPPARELTEEEKAELKLKEQAKELKAQGTAAYRKRNFDEALRLYAEADDVNPDPADISFQLNQAAVHFESGDLDQCIQVCRSAIEAGREHRAPFALLAKAFARIGNAHVKQADYGAAVEAYERSLMESHSDDVHKRLKRTKADMKKAAESAYLDPEKAKEAKAEGNEFFTSGNFPKAIEAYSEAIKRDPTQAVYWANRAAARTKLMDFAAAMTDVDHALKLDPTYLKAYTRKGALQFLMKEYHKAMETYQEGLKIDPKNAECMEGLQRTVHKIQSASAAPADPERAARAMADPEIQSILRDPMVQQVLKDFNENPSAARQAMRDPGMGAKIEKLIAAGVLGMK